MTTQEPDRQAAARFELNRDLRRLHRVAGEPSLRTMADSIGDVSHSTINAVLRGKTLPRWPILEKIVKYLDGDVAYYRLLWLDAQESEDEFRSPSFDTARRTVFLSWSGHESRNLARVLASWLPRMLQSVEVYLSSDEIGSGIRWDEAVARLVEESDFGLLCLTRNNLHSPWMNFEAGAIARAGTSRVIPVLLDMSPAEVTGPIASFQAVSCFDKEGMYRLLKSINNVAHVGRVDPEALEAVFEALWPRLESALREVLQEAGTETRPAPRSPEDLLAEIAERVRRIERRSATHEDAAERGTVTEYDAGVDLEMARQQFKDARRRGKEILRFPSPSVAIVLGTIQTRSGHDIYPMPDVFAARVIAAAVPDSVEVEAPVPASALNGRARENNLVLVGNSKRNPVTQKVLAHKAIRDLVMCEFLTSYGDESEPELRIENAVYGQAALEAEMFKSDEHANADLALLAKLPNPFNPRATVFIVAGLHALGTRGAAEFLATWTPWDTLDFEKEIGDDYFTAVLYVEGVGPKDELHVTKVRAMEKSLTVIKR
jgi:cell pole-organizing protein PopZ